MARLPEECVMRTSNIFQKRLIDLIDDQDLSKLEFAKFAGVNKEVISRATIYGIIPSVRSLVKIADALNISIPYLLGETNDKTFYRADSPTSFHERLGELKCEKGCRYSHIAARMHFQENSFYEWKRKGLLPSLDYLKELAEFFDVSIDYLLGRTDERKF